MLACDATALPLAWRGRVSLPKLRLSRSPLPPRWRAFSCQEPSSGKMHWGNMPSVEPELLTF